MINCLKIIFLQFEFWLKEVKGPAGLGDEPSCPTGLRDGEGVCLVRLC